jgi:hypothetical protein
MLKRRKVLKRGDRIPSFQIYGINWELNTQKKKSPKKRG